LSRPGGFIAASLAAALGAATGCQTVDLGTPPADVNTCMPSEQVFVDSIWPNFLGADYGGKHCYDSACHGVGSANGLVLMVPAESGALPLPSDWQNDYASTINELECSDVDDSKLLLFPENKLVHGGGMLIAPTGAEAMAVEAWVGGGP
jgi:hypothetical protein